MKKIIVVLMVVLLFGCNNEKSVDSIKAKSPVAKRIELEVGKYYYLDNENPFEEITIIKIIDIKEGWVKYMYVNLKLESISPHLSNKISRIDDILDGEYDVDNNLH